MNMEKHLERIRKKYEEVEDKLNAVFGSAPARPTVGDLEMMAMVHKWASDRIVIKALQK